MKFDELDSKMRIFETANDRCALPGIYIVARIDGRGFTRLTKEVHRFEAPFDVRFRDYMTDTTEHLMNCGFQITYGYTQSDEISLLFHRDENSFGRKTRKIDSVLAGEASAKFSLLLARWPPLIAASANCRPRSTCATTFDGATKTPTATRSTPTVTGCFAKRVSR